jgi:outer membrane protein OmpA-like peptidoglycan-associated protein
LNRALAQEGLTMMRFSGKTNFMTMLSIAAIGTALWLGTVPARAQNPQNNPSEDEMLQKLTPKPRVLTRGLSVNDDASRLEDAENKAIDGYRDRPAQSLSPADRDKIATIAENKPNVDLTINFEYNSAEISPKSLSEVQKLGRVLTNPALKGSTFLLAGYTDAAGGTPYNQKLSERRAESIRHYLEENYHIPSAELVTVGYGKTRLKDNDHPLSEVNRRVQVVNMENKRTASR